MKEKQKTLPATSRPDLAMAKCVEAGIARQDTHGPAEAAAYLAENGVNFNVIVRVLAEPDRRRPADTIPADILPPPPPAA